MTSTENNVELENRNLHAFSEDATRNEPESHLLTPSPQPQVVSKMRLDANVYATKKTIAQGMLDIALLTANASQLKYVLQVGNNHEFFYPLVTMISISIILQVLVGLGFLLNAQQNINHAEEQKNANRMNNILTGGIFTITVLNVLISAFGMKTSDEEIGNLDQSQRSRSN